MTPPSKVIRPIRVFETDTVEIQWTLRDGSSFTERRNIPPPNTRAAIQQAQTAPVDDTLDDTAEPYHVP